jgi:hypothetical protein
VVERCVVDRAKVPDDEAHDPEGQGDERVGEPNCAGEAEHDEERSEIAEQQVLDHVRGEPAGERGCVRADCDGDAEQ